MAETVNQEEQPSQGQVADAISDSWVDTWAPAKVRPYLRLARLDRPIGTWLLLWPCLWSLALAQTDASTGLAGFVWLGLLFAVGATVMRGAGCTYNDIVDRKYDAQVARTANRPVASGAISVKRAWIFLIAQSLIGLIILLQFNAFTIGLGIASLALVAIYPYMKRFTYWPQAWLGLTFNWGALMGWSTVTGSLSWPPLLLYMAAFAWTMGYDTIYAHQDKEDDALIGVKSTALKLGETTKTWLYLFYGTTAGLLILVGTSAHLSWLFYLGLAAAAAHLARQISRVNIHSPDSCLNVFRSNREFGALLFISVLLGLIGG